MFNAYLNAPSIVCFICKGGAFLYPYMQQPYPMGPINPMMNAQQRLAVMEQQYPQFAQQGQMMQQQQNQPMILKGRPVSSYDEAKVAMIDLDGSVFYFIDNANKAIYTKQINLDGTATINTYALVNPNGQPAQQAQQNTSPDVRETSVTRSEFAEAINTLQGQINTLQDKIKGGDSAHVQSSSNDGNAQRKK